MSETVETHWGYRITETWTDENGAAQSLTNFHEVGPGDTNRVLAARIVNWRRTNCSGTAEVLSRTVTYSDWAVSQP